MSESSDQKRVGTETVALAYAYDAAGRLATVTAGGNPVEVYRYDSAGNRTYARSVAAGIETTYAACGPDDRITTTTDATYTVDADGFLRARETSAGTTTYDYSALGELTEVVLPGGRAITYAYDAFGRRVSRSVDGTLTDRYLWADATHLLAVYDATATPRYRFTYADSRVPLSAETSAGTLRILTDQVGTVRALATADGTIVDEIERDSFGVPTSGDTGFPLGFAGGLADADTGLVHFGAREYDPALGRWLSRDPIDFAGGDANLYRYCVGDSVGLVDPSGLFTASVGVGAQAALFYGGSGSKSLAFDGRDYADYLTTGVGGQSPVLDPSKGLPGPDRLLEKPVPV